MLMKESVYSELTLMATRKTWPFMYLLNDLILVQQHSGIGRYVELMASIRTTDLRIQRNLEAGAITEDEIVALKVAHIEGALYLLFFGHLIATGCFIIEKCIIGAGRLSNRLSFKSAADAVKNSLAFGDIRLRERPSLVSAQRSSGEVLNHLTIN